MNPNSMKNISSCHFIRFQFEIYVKNNPAYLSSDFDLFLVQNIFAYFFVNSGSF